MNDIQILANQVLALAWIRCVQEEGVDFINKRTNEIEKDEKKIYDAFEQKSELFDLPAAKGSKSGLEKNILEVIGGYIIKSPYPQVHQIIMSQTFRQIINDKIEEIKGHNNE